MKHAFAIVILLFTSYFSVAQDQVFTKYVQHEVQYFHGITVKGHRFFGVAKTRKDIQSAIRHLTNKVLKKNKDQMAYKAIYPIDILAPSTTNVVNDFKKVAADGYVFLPLQDYNALEIAQNNALDTSVWYYRKVTGINPSLAQSRVTQLLNDYSRYFKL